MLSILFCLILVLRQGLSISWNLPNSLDILARKTKYAPVSTPQLWYYKHALPCLVFFTFFWGFKLRSLCLQGKHFTNGVSHQLIMNEPLVLVPNEPKEQPVSWTCGPLELWDFSIDVTASQSVSVEQKLCDWFTVMQVWSCDPNSESGSWIRWNNREWCNHHIDKGTYMIVQKPDGGIPSEILH